METFFKSVCFFGVYFAIGCASAGSSKVVCGAGCDTIKGYEAVAAHIDKVCGGKAKCLLLY